MLFGGRGVVVSRVVSTVAAIDSREQHSLANGQWIASDTLHTVGRTVHHFPDSSFHFTLDARPSPLRASVWLDVEWDFQSDLNNEPRNRVRFSNELFAFLRSPLSAELVIVAFVSFRGRDIIINGRGRPSPEFAEHKANVINVQLGHPIVRVWSGSRANTANGKKIARRANEHFSLMQMPHINVVADKANGNCDSFTDCVAAFSPGRIAPYL